MICTTQCISSEDICVAVPRHFHSDPLDQDTTLRHIRAVHQGSVVGDISELLNKYAVRGQLPAICV